MAQMNDLRPIVGGQTSFSPLLSPVLQTAHTGAEGEPESKILEHLKPWGGMIDIQEALITWQCFLSAFLAFNEVISLSPPLTSH